MFLDPYDYDMDIAVQREEAFEDGEIQGEQNKALKSAINLLKENVSPELIARCVGLPLEEVKKLAEGLGK